MKTLPICTLALLLWLTPVNNLSFLQPMPALAQDTIPDLLLNVARMAVSELHTCVLTKEGGVRCWGSNEDGQLGDGTKETKHTPVPVQGLNSDIIAIDVGA